MSVNVNSIQDIKTVKGKHFVGMKREEAKEMGHSVFRTFNKIDTYRDGVLSFDEIMNYREEEIKAKKKGLTLWGIYGCLQALSGIMMANISRETMKAVLDTTPELAHTSKIIILGSVLAICLTKYSKIKKARQEEIEYQNINNTQIMQNQQLA